ncbi:MAG: helix-turn-helix domain-containing protein [Candidatus Moranbacteria bacterium]|nr:helix-turn-helix domain-containing protein [Candidatus Moranbacteria bacterium]MDD3964904.1 helix-turn-helix domain-containing protein [Candidatus Moranbacteria bacterium]
MEIKNIINRGNRMEGYIKNSRDKWREIGFSMIPHKVLLDKRLTRPAKLVYCNLVMHTFAGKEDCHPSQRTIASETNCAKNTVIKAIGELEEIGYLRVERSSKNSRKVNRYILLIKQRKR